MTGIALAQIEAVLQQVRAKVPHGISCGALTRDFRGPGRCDCDREIRVVQDQARTVERREFELRHALAICLREMICAAKFGYTGADDYHEAIRDGEAALGRATEAPNQEKS